MTENDHIQRGFNAAYQLHKLDPSFAKFVQNTLTQSVHPYAQGFQAGADKYAKEIANTPSKEDQGFTKRFFNKNQKNSPRHSPNSNNKPMSPDI